MKLLQHIFKSKLAFEPVDPLGDGLREMIQREKTESGAISLHEDSYDTRLWSEVTFEDTHQ